MCNSEVEGNESYEANDDTTAVQDQVCIFRWHNQSVTRLMFCSHERSRRADTSRGDDGVRVRDGTEPVIELQVEPLKQNHEPPVTTTMAATVQSTLNNALNNSQCGQKPRRCHRIAMVCDFFYPRLGGVEMHIWSLAFHLLRLGHKVIVITHAYNCPDVEYQSDDGSGAMRRKSKRAGVRYLPGGLKVYYCPFLPMTDEDCLPTFTITFPLLRWIFIREGIEIVHAHQATSTMANEAVTYAAELGLASVYTDHSLFGFDDIASIILNRVSW